MCDGVWLTNTKTSVTTQHQQQLKIPFHDSNNNNDCYNNSDDIRPGITQQQILDPSHMSPYLLFTWDARAEEKELYA